MYRVSVESLLHMQSRSKCFLRRAVHTAAIFVCAACNHEVRESSVFKGVNLKSILLGSNVLSEVRQTTSLQPEYNFKDCELVLSVPGGQLADALSRIMSGCSNAVVQFGGTASAKTDLSPFANFELVYETTEVKGFIRLYSAEVGIAKVKLTAAMFECPSR